jgi:site-specific recombinase XerD
MFGYVADFLNYQRNCLSRSSSTLTGYELGLRLACTHFGNNNVTPIGVSEWVGTMQHLKRSTVKQYVTALNLYCKFLIANGTLERNPCYGISIRVDDLNETQTLTDVEITQILGAGACIRRQSDNQHQMYTLILSLIAYTGARCGEVLNLRATDVDPTANTLCFRRTKTHRNRYVPIPPQCRDALINQIAVCQMVRQDMLFTSTSGTSIKSSTIAREMQKRAKLAGIAKHVHPHQLRHSFITMLIRQDAPIAKVGRLVGHSDINSTMHYTHLTAQDLQPILNMHPQNMRHLPVESVISELRHRIERLATSDSRLRIKITQHKSSLKVEIHPAH